MAEETKVKKTNQQKFMKMLKDANVAFEEQCWTTGKERAVIMPSFGKKPLVFIFNMEGNLLYLLRDYESPID